MSYLPYICFLCFMLLMPWGFIPISLTFTLITMCRGTRTPGLVSDVLGLYTHWSYTCSAKISFNLGLMFSVNDFILCSCSLWSFFHTYALWWPFIYIYIYIYTKWNRTITWLLVTQPTQSAHPIICTWYIRV
jgi:hypothetical protein